MFENRRDAINGLSKFYFTGKPCKHGHYSKRYTSNGGCVKCNEDQKDYRAEWERLNPEKMKAKRKRRRRDATVRQREYRSENREMHRAFSRNRRARVKDVGGSHCGEDILAMLILQKNKCAEPTCRVDLSDGYHVDHIMPIALGGGNGPENLQCLCPSCNLSKSAKHPDDWAREKGRLL